MGRMREKKRKLELGHQVAIKANVWAFPRKASHTTWTGTILDS